MKTKHLFWILPLLALLVIAAVQVTPGQKTSDYPHTNQAPDSSLFNLAVTNITPRTNMNISALELAQQFTNGLATTNFVNTQDTLVSNGVVNFVLVTSNTLSGASFAAFETLTNGTRIALGTNNNWTFGVTGYVAAGVVNLGIDALALSNSIVSANAFQTNQFTTNVAGSPVVGALWWNGTNSGPLTSDLGLTNRARTAFEWNPLIRSLRAGDVGGDFINAANYGGFSSNYWNGSNIGICTIGFGSNCLVKADMSSVLGGFLNVILTNSKMSVISGGSNNIIDTNASFAVIAGGRKNQIYGNADRTIHGEEVIGGGSENVINEGSGTGGTRSSTIGGGAQNTINAREATLAGGFGNTIRTDGHFGFLGSGDNNTLGRTGTADESKNAVLCGGTLNTVAGQYSFIGAGKGNSFVQSSDLSFIGGGASNVIGTQPSFSTKYGFIGGGFQNQIANDSEFSIIAGGFANTMAGSDTNCVIGGGFQNSISSSCGSAQILGGVYNNITSAGDFGGIVGVSNSVSAEGAYAIGRGLANSTPNSTMIGYAGNWVRAGSNGIFFSTGAKIVVTTTTNAVAGGALMLIRTPVASAGAAETNLITATIPAHTLTNLNDSFSFRASGRFAATANAKQLKMVYGSETIFDSGSQIVNSGAWTIEGEVIRTGNTSQSVNAEFHGAGVTLFTTAASLDLVQTNGIDTVLKMTSIAAGDGDVTNRTMTVYFWPAP